MSIYNIIFFFRMHGDKVTFLIFKSKLELQLQINNMGLVVKIPSLNVVLTKQHQGD